MAPGLAKLSHVSLLPFYARSDIKPDNVLLRLDTSGRVLAAALADFGLAQRRPKRALVVPTRCVDCAGVGAVGGVGT